MRIGYARVSTAEQNLNLQLDALKKAKCKRIYEEHGSGKDSARLELLSCLKAMREIRGRDGSTPDANARIVRLAMAVQTGRLLDCCDCYDKDKSRPSRVQPTNRFAA